MSLKQFSDLEMQHALRKHFYYGYQLYSDSKLVPNATFEKSKEVQRCFSGVPFPFFNAIMDSSNWKGSWEECVKEQLQYFQKAKLPFVWYNDENTNDALEKILHQHGFQSIGIFQGMVGVLDKAMPIPQVSKEYSLEQVTSAKDLAEFSNHVCDIFGMPSPSKEMYNRVLLSDLQKSHPSMFHWVARRQGKIVSTVSTLIKDNIVSFWNAATNPELRRQGLNTAIWCLGLEHAFQRECRIGISYLMTEALAFGICSKLGYKTKWRFNTFLSPNV